jgi:hypothetical protein
MKMRISADGSGMARQAEVPIEFRLPEGRSYAAKDC